jgi:hypothetical protein
MFDKCDKNGDGRVTKDEFKGCTSARSEKKFSKMDSDKDGSISRDEAQQWAAHRKGSGGAPGGGSGAGRAEAEWERRAPARPNDPPARDVHSLAASFHPGH